MDQLLIRKSIFGAQNAWFWWIPKTLLQPKILIKCAHGQVSRILNSDNPLASMKWALAWGISDSFQWKHNQSLWSLIEQITRCWFPNFNLFVDRPELHWSILLRPKTRGKSPENKQQTNTVLVMIGKHTRSIFFSSLGKQIHRKGMVILEVTLFRFMMVWDPWVILSMYKNK